MNEEQSLITNKIDSNYGVSLSNEKTAISSGITYTVNEANEFCKSIESLAKEYDSSASLEDFFSLDKENCVETDAASFLDVFSNKNTVNLDSKIQILNADEKVNLDNDVSLKDSKAEDSDDDKINIDLCYSYRKNWNDTAHDDIDFTAYGFSTGVVVNTYVKILDFDIKIKLNLELDFDVLVGTASAKGLPIKRIRLTSDIPDDSTYGDSREPLKVTTRK